VTNFMVLLIGHREPYIPGLLPKLLRKIFVRTVGVIWMLPEKE
jgi:hypothetical protein